MTSADKPLESPPSSSSLPAWLNDAAHDAYRIGSQISNTIDNHKVAVGTAFMLGGFALASHGLSSGLFKTEEAVRAGTATADAAAALRGAGALKSIDQLDHVLFDFDNTLIPTNKAFDIYKGALRDELITHSPLTPAQIDSGIAAAQTETRSIFLAKDLSTIKPLVEAHPGQDVNALYAGSVDRIKAAYFDALQPREDIVPMLEKVRATGKPVMMYTAGGSGHTVEKLEATGLGKYFDRIFTARANPFENSLMDEQTRTSSLWDKLTEVGPQPKKTTLGFSNVIADANLTPSRTLMVGDHTIEDVARGQSMGLRTALARYYENSLPQVAKPDLVLQKPSDLLTKLKIAS